MIAPIQNPYNLGVPIDDESKIAGREAELEKIDECLDQILAGAHVNVAIIGESGMGKTSLLNIAYCHALVRGILPIKLTMGKDMSIDELGFFRELYHTILAEGTRLGMFQALSEPVNFSISQLECAVKEPEPILPLPLKFPRMFAECVSNHVILPTMTSMLVSDFKFIAIEAKKARVGAIALLFDNCDYMTISILEKLKVLLTDVEGYFMCFAGSNNMLQTWDQVFSPMPRVLLKINLLPFPNEAVTRRCVRRPLDKTKYKEIEVDTTLCTELHELTTGNPYEIQMLCYLMYQRLAGGKDSKMTLHPTILESILDQLESQRPQITQERAFQKVIHGLTSDDLELAFNHMEFEGLSCNEQAIYELAFSKFNQRNLKEKLKDVRKNREKLAKLNIVELRDDMFSFRTGTFGKIFLKYFYESTIGKVQRSRRIVTSVPGSLESSLLVKFVRELFAELGSTNKYEESAWVPFPARTHIPLKTVVDGFCRSVWDNDTETLKKSELYFPVILVIPRLATRSSDGHESRDHIVMQVEFSCKSRVRGTLLFLREMSEQEIDPEHSRKRFNNLLQKRIETASEYGVSIEIVESEVIPGSVVTSASKLDGQYTELVDATVDAGEALLGDDWESASEFVVNQSELLSGLKGSVLAEAIGNIGFVEMCGRDFDNAAEHTRQSLEISRSPVRLINLSYILASSDDDGADRLEAEELIKEAIKLIENEPTQTAWLLKVFLVPTEKLSTSELNQDLVENPVIDSLARCTLASLLALRREFAEAVRSCELAELRSRDRAFPLRTKARILLIKGEMEPAMEFLRKATEVEPGDPWAKIEYDKLRFEA